MKFLLPIPSGCSYDLPDVNLCSAVSQPVDRDPVALALRACLLKMRQRTQGH